MNSYRITLDTTTNYWQHSCSIVVISSHILANVISNGHSQLSLAELGKPSPNIDLLRTTGSNGRT